jgi:hypothetical protein
MPSIINNAIYKLTKRAEKLEKEHLLKTFVDVGPLLTLLTNIDHQIIYGRRGTGKTHALSYLQGELENYGNMPVYVDMRNIGSNNGIYSDFNLPLGERATRLLIDTFSSIHDQILDNVLLKDGYDLSQFGPLLDELAMSIKDIEVVGSKEIEETKSFKKNINEESTLKLSIKDSSFSMKNSDSNEREGSYRQKTIGDFRHRVHFTTINNVFNRLIALLGKKQLWILIDEWAEVPLDLQPYLADLFRRCLFSIKGITVKIAAIEKRTNFKLDNINGYIGLETGADISASLNLDEFMVFENNASKSIHFFKTLLYNHVNQNLVEANLQPIKNADIFINDTFTQVGAFEELVKASEGIPRDAINILLQSAIKADNDKISIPFIRAAARLWYNQDKEKAVSGRQSAKLLLRWIIDEVIGKKKNRAFLLSSDVQDEDIGYLFDNRLLHIIKQNISSKDRVGERFNVYSLDFGTYVHLINTVDQPKILFSVDGDQGEEAVEVPANDYRSIRRSILDLEKYNKNLTEMTNLY